MKKIELFKTGAGWMVSLDDQVYTFTEELYQKFAALGWVEIDLMEVA